MSKNNRARRKEKQQARKRRLKKLQQCEQQSLERFIAPDEFPDESDLMRRAGSTGVLSALEKRHRSAPNDVAVLLELIKKHQTQDNAELACHQEARIARARWPDNILVGEFAPTANKLELACHQAAINFGFRDQPDHLIKKAEAAAWLGQDQFIVAACR